MITLRHKLWVAPRILVPALFVAMVACGGDGGGDGGENPLGLVDLFVGTGGDGFGVGSALPGAGMPFGMVKLSPDTSAVNGYQLQFNHCGGYAFDDPMIVGFSHTHMHGIGVPGYGSVLFMPSLGFDPSAIEDNGFRRGYDKQSEVALPGYYAVTLESGIRAELTAGQRTGVHRYTWPDTAEDGVLNIDLAYAIGDGRGIAGAVEILPDERRVRGYTHTDSAHGGDFLVWFDALFDHDIADFGIWQEGGVTQGSPTAEATSVGAYLVFDLAADPAVLAQVGISYTGPEGALANREAEAVTTFEGARLRAQRAWTDRLEKVEVRGGDAEERRIFYSALYHVYQHPTLVTDADDSYRGFDDQVHNDGRPYYTDFSLWDTYRTLHPLLILLEPTESSHMAQSLVRMADQWGNLPRWPLATSDSNSMIGTSADVVLAESYLKGVTSFDVEGAWGYMWAHARGPVCCAGRSGVEQYLSLGYVPADVTGGSVSKTQEYAWDDWALSLLATALGKQAEAATLWEQSRTIGSLYDPEVGFFRGRLADGSWDPSFEPTAWEDYFTEGDAWQHLWLSPHVDLLSEIMGGREQMLQTLEEFFELAREDWERSPLGTWAPLPYYWHGNEPDIHAAYLFAAAGRPHLTQRWVRWIMETFYGLGPKGLAGNDDAGTLSAWYVFSALGFYPLAGSDLYYVGTPAFQRATVHLEGGELVITAKGLDRGHYVQSVTLNGEPLEQPFFTHADIVSGGKLTFVLGAEPSDWGSQD